MIYILFWYFWESKSVILQSLLLWACWMELRRASQNKGDPSTPMAWFVFVKKPAIWVTTCLSPQALVCYARLAFEWLMFWDGSHSFSLDPAKKWLECSMPILAAIGLSIKENVLLGTISWSMELYKDKRLLYPCPTPFCAWCQDIAFQQLAAHVQPLPDGPVQKKIWHDF